MSAASGSGTGDLLDEILKRFTKKSEPEIEENIPRFAVVGRPNAGKSSIINAFIGEERYIVTDIAGTTRDSIYTRYDKFGFDFYLVDTAGIRKKGKVTEDLEYYSVIRSIRAIEGLRRLHPHDRCHPRHRGARSQYLPPSYRRTRRGWWSASTSGIWSKTSRTRRYRPSRMPYGRASLRFVDFPIVYASALTKQRIFKVLESAVQVYKNRQRKIPHLETQRGDALAPLRTIRPLHTRVSM